MLRPLHTKGLFSLIFVAMLAAACSTPKYYVFKTIKNNPLEEAEKAVPKTAAAEVTVEAATIAIEEPIAEETAIASTENVVSPVSLQQATKKVTESAAPAEPKKISRLEKIKTAIQVKKEIKKALKEQKEMAQDPESETTDKSQLIALILAIVIGGLGIHRFYLGYTWQGIVQLLLALTSWLIIPGIALLVWVIFDIIRIATGKLKPKKGEYGETLDGSL